MSCSVPVPSGSAGPITAGSLHVSLQKEVSCCDILAEFCYSSFFTGLLKKFIFNLAAQGVKQVGNPVLTTNHHKEIKCCLHRPAADIVLSLKKLS